MKTIFNKENRVMPQVPMGKADLPWWQGRFRVSGYRLTLPRRVILEVLDKAKKHLSAEDIYLAVHKTYPAAGLTTVYRTLELLVEMGWVEKFDFGNGRSRYELSEGPALSHHHHLICNSCGRAIDYRGLVSEEAQVLSQLEKIALKNYAFKLNAHQIHFLGLCDKCSL